MTNDRADQMPEPLAWMRLDREALRVAWQRGQAAPPMDATTRAAVALLVRPVVPNTAPPRAA
jgi:hypothetical protein